MTGESRGCARGLYNCHNVGRRHNRRTQQSGTLLPPTGHATSRAHLPATRPHSTPSPHTGCCCCSSRAGGAVSRVVRGSTQCGAVMRGLVAAPCTGVDRAVGWRNRGKEELVLKPRSSSSFICQVASATLRWQGVETGM